MSSPYRILFVCTGNVCRSPLAEQMLQDRLDASTPNAFRVESAGTGALVDSAMDPRVAEFARTRSLSPGSFRARQLNAVILREQDLILGLTRGHRSKIVQLRPALVNRTFTLREFARILPLLAPASATNPEDRWRDAVRRAPRARSRPADPSDDDVVDPFHRKAEVYEQMFQQLVPAVQELVDWERRCVGVH